MSVGSYQDIYDDDGYGYDDDKDNSDPNDNNNNNTNNNNGSDADEDDADYLNQYLSQETYTTSSSSSSSHTASINYRHQATAKHWSDFKYICLAPEQLMEKMHEIVKQLPPCTTRILLSHFNWDKERLLERFYDGDQEKLFSEAHIVNPFRQIRHAKTVIDGMMTSSNNSSYICDICLEIRLNNGFVGLECRHLYCTECWFSYLKIKILDDGKALAIPCPHRKCDILVNEDTIYNVMKSSPNIVRRFQYLSAQTFVQQNRLMKYCPSPGCTYAIEANSNEGVPVLCQCGYRFCFGCSFPAHEPVTCHYYKMWMKKCEDDSETAHWIHANTKQCPKCHATIEKSGGCNHMVCRNLNCKADFCWVCMGPWEPHGSSWYSCNRYNESSAKLARDDQSQHRQALERYLFYYNRYTNHMKSLKFEDKLYSQIEHKMKDMQFYGLAWIETQFLKNAVDTLCQCRNTLMYTYVFAFFLKKNNHCAIFEDNQSDLELATEMLSEYLEREIDKDSLNEIKVKVQDNSKYCEKRRQVLLESVFEGYDNEIWEYIR